MKISILGWGVLTYLLALSPGILANEDHVCKELREEMTAEELQSPRGLIAKIVCPSLETESTPLDVTEEIQSLNHDELLSLCSTELRQLAYVIYHKYPLSLRDERHLYKINRPILYSEYHLSREVKVNGLPSTDEPYENLKILPKGLSPIAPIYERRIYVLHESNSYYSIPHFARPTTGLPEENVKRQWVDLQQLPGKELLDFSPTFFLTRHNRPAEALILLQELSARSNNVDFVVSFKRALGVVAKTYPMYFVSDADRDWLSVNLNEAIRYIFQHNLYVYVLSIHNEEVIANLVNGMGTVGRLKRVIRRLYMESLSLNNFDTEMISRPVRNLEMDKRLAMSKDDLKNYGFLFSAKNYQDNCDTFKDMVAKFLGPAKRYANVTFASVERMNNVPYKITRTTPHYVNRERPWKRPRMYL